jgi:predicted phage terminase large subunit-like protein
MQVIKPQPGPQWDFLSSPADIVIGGGSYFGGKTVGLLLDPLRDIQDRDMKGVFFRRVMPMITTPGGVWDEAQKLYRAVGASFLTSPQHKITFPRGGTLTFSHLQYEDDRYNWDGAQAALIYFDQLEQFTEKQFWHLALGRNRTTSGVVPRVRATCNPMPDIWLSRLLQWWWDPETGYAIPERSGVVRYLLRVENTVYWGSSVEDLRAQFPDMPKDQFLPLSFTFIPSSYKDNPIGIQANPQYAARLQNLPRVERERGMKGNWKIKDDTGDGLFNPDWWKYITPDAWLAMLPRVIELGKWSRGWDTAGGTGSGADFSSGGLVGHLKDKRIVIANVTRGKWTPHQRNKEMRTNAIADKKRYDATCYFWKSRTPDVNTMIIDALAGLPVQAVVEKGSKFERAKTLAAQAEAGNVYLVEDEWNAEFVREGANFKNEDSDNHRKDDQIDSVVLADKVLW